jgi:hypothetical protein
MTQADFNLPAHVSDDRCLDLAQGLLDPADRQVTLGHLKMCRECERRFQEIAASHARALSAAASVLQHSSPVLATVSPLRTRSRTRRWILPAAAAACIAALLGVARFTRLSPPEIAVVTGSESRLPPAQLRGAIRDLQVSTADTSIAAGLTAYNRSDYSTARQRLETAKADGRLEIVRRIYLGSTLLELGDAARAALFLRDVDLKLVPEPWKSETQWNLALALERSGHAATADSILSVLSRERNPAGERARSHRASTSRPK